MANTRKVEVLLDFDSRGAVSAIRAADGTLLQFARNAENTDNTVQKGFRGMGAGAVAFGTVAAQALAAVASRLADVAGNVVSTGAAYEQQMARVGALTQATAAEFSALSQTARQLGASTVFSASEVADGMGFLAQAGFTTNEITSAMPGLLAQAAAGQIELAQAADITSNVLSGFGIAAEESGRVADILTKASISSNTTILSLGDTLKFVAPVAASMGLEIEELAAATGILGDAGIQGSLAGTALRGSLLQLATPSKIQRDLMQELNFQIERTDGSTKSLAEIIGSLETSTRGMSDAQRTATLSILVGQEAASGFTALIASGSQNLKTFTNELKNAGGTAERVAGQQMNTFNGMMEELNGAIEELSITLFGTFDTELRGVIQGAIEFLTEFRDEMAGLLRFVVVNGGVAFEAFQEIVKIVFSNFGDIMYNTMTGFPQLVRIAIRLAGEKFMAFVEFLKEQFGNVKDLFIGIGQVIIGAFTLDRAKFDEGLAGIKQSMIAGASDIIDLGKELGANFGQAFGDAAAVMFAGVDTSELQRIISEFVTLSEATAQVGGGGGGGDFSDPTPDPLADPNIQRLSAIRDAEQALTETTEQTIARRMAAMQTEVMFQGQAAAANIKAMEEQARAKQAITDAYASSIEQTIMSDQMSVESGRDAANAVIGNVTQVIKAKLAEAIAKMLASLPFPSNIILGGVAAVGINAVFDRLIPKFNTGVSNFSGGLALVGDDPRRGGSGELVSLPRGASVAPAVNTARILNNLERLRMPSPASDAPAINRQTEVLTASLQGLGDRIESMRVQVDLMTLRDAQNRQDRQLRAIGNTAG